METKERLDNLDFIIGYMLKERGEEMVLHTVGPIISIGLPTGRQELQLASCYRSCLEEAERHALESIAFCCISTGVFRFPNERAAEIAVETVRGFPCQSVKTVVFNVFKDKDLELYRRLV
ncbi:MAG: macro domain-containing protein [Bacteroidaceae bacterium]|nr:macro domain-containing protein [Bacteroidaceae bacterium]